MKNKRIGLLSVSLSVVAALFAGINLSPIEKTEKENVVFDAEDPNADWGGLRAKPFGDRYTTNWTSEPKYTTQSPLQFTTMDVGDVWKNYQGFESGNKPVTVAVIDSGIDIYHEDFLSADAKNATITESNVEQYSILDPKSCYIHDTSGGYNASSVITEVGIKKAYDTDTYDEKEGTYYSHGTASAACIGAAINGVGGLGIAPKCNLLIIRMDFYFTSLDKAIRYAADNGADVINMSLGAYADSFTDGYGEKQEGSSSTASALTSAINYALGKDCVVVAAAGNEKTNHKSYPACNAGVVGVGALDSKSKTTAAGFSNYNLDSDTSSGNNNVDVMAPGYVYTANMDSKNGPKSSGNLKDSSYQNTQGTSFASPLTAGAIALARSKFPNKTHTEIENLLFSTCNDIGNTGWDKKFGYGRVNVSSLLGTTYDVEDLTLNKTSLELYNNGVTGKLIGDVIPSTATNTLIHWSSSNTSVATVDSTSNAGSEVVITPNGVGTTIITAKSDFNQAITASCTVTVKQYVSSEFTLSVGKTTLVEGETTQASVSFTKTNPTESEILFDSSNENVATISDSGLITAIGPGTTTITAISADDVQEITITVTGDPTKSNATIEVADWPSGGTSGTGSALSVTKGDITISLTKGYNASSEIRNYSSGTLTLSVANGTVSSFEVQCADSTYKGGTISLKSGGGTTSSKNSSGTTFITYTAGATPSSSVTIGNSSQWRFTNINVTYKSNGTPVVTNYTVTFDSNGGTGTMASATTNGSSYVAPECTFTKTNYDFDKWALGSATGTKYAVGETISNISSNITLYATWTEKQSTGGGEGSDTETSTKYLFTNSKWNPWTSVKDGAGYSNSGVQVTAKGTGANANSTKSFNNVKKAIVTYCTNASSGAGTITVKIGSTELGSFNVTTSGGTTARTNEITSTTALSGVANISVSCSANSIYVCGIEIFEGGSGDTPTPTPTNYTVSFNSNGGSGTMENATTNGSSYVAPECTFAKTNYDFDKWALGSATGTKYAVGETISNISSDITLFATWKETQSSGGDGDLSYWTNWISQNSSALSTGGTTLVTALRNKIANVAPGTSNTLSYDDLWNAYATTDGIPGSNGTRIYDMYGGFEFRKGTDQAGSYQNEGDVYNREHSVPKSWFGEKAPAISDIIHVVPTDGKVNGMRSNNTFGEVSNASYSFSFPTRSYNGVEYQKAGISKLGTPKAINGVTTSESVVFEPDDQYKGDFARIYMYFAVRYGDTTCSAITGSGSAIFTNTFTNANPYVTNYGLALLKKWHEQDPVSEKERLRNDGVEKVQGNRNPFVDYPQWADKIFGTTTPGGDTPTPTKTLTSITISGQKTSYVVGDSFVAPTVTAHYSDNSTAPVTATFSGYDLNTVGDQTVTVSYTEGGIEKTTTYDITVSAATIAVTGVVLNNKSLELNVGGSETLTATVSPNNATNKAVTWESSNPSVATVSNGLISGVSAGSATITVKTVDGNKTDTCAVTVKSSGSTGDDTTKYYEKVTSDQEDWSGEYIIAYVDNATANCWTGIAGSGNMTVATISNNKIDKPENACTVTVETMTGGYSVKVNGGTNNGKYIYGKSGSNTINFGSTPSLNTFSYDGGVKMTSDSTTFQKNGSSNELKYFRSNQTILQFFKLTSGSTPEPEKEIVSVELECNVSEVNFGAGRGTFDVPAKLKATYSDSTTGYITPNEFNYTVNTYKLGKQTIYAIYNGVRYEKIITVSNNNADIGDSSGESETASLTGKTWSSYVTDNGTNCLEYDLSGSQSEKVQIQRQHCASTTGGFQFEKNTVGSIFNISDNGKINSISFSGSGDSLVLYGGDTKDTCNNLISPKAATASGKVMAMAGITSYEYDLSGSDYHFFKITRPSVSTTTTVTNISITYGAGANSHDSTPLQQTISWSQYFLDMTYAVCSLNSDGDNSEGLSAIWSDLSTEYGYMNSDSKSLFMSSDDETVMAARERYVHIANHYGKNLNNFAGVALASRNSFNLFNGLDTFNSDHPENILTLILALTGAATIAGYFIVKKRKEI